MLWDSEQPRYGGSGIVPLEPDRLWRLTGHCAVVLAALPSKARPEQPEMGSFEPEDDDIHPVIRRKRRQKPEDSAC